MSSLQRRRGKPDPSTQASAYVAKMCSSFPRLRADASSLSQLTASLAATLDSSASSSSSSSSPLRLCTATACPTCLWRAPPAGVAVCASCYGPLPSASLSAFAVLGDDDGVTAHVAAHVLCSPACVADFDPSTPVAIATDKSEPALAAAAAAAAVAGAAGRTGNDGGGKPTTPQFLWHGCLALAYTALVHALYHAGAIAPTALLDPLSWCVALGLLSSLVSLVNDISPLLDPHSLDSQHPPRQAPRAPSALASAAAGIRAVAGPMQLASGVCALVLWAGARAEMESFAPDPALLVRVGAAQGTGSAAAAAAAAAASSSSLITDGGGVVTAGGGILLWLMITLLPIVDAVVAAVFFPPFSSPSGVSMPKSSAATAATAPASRVSAGVSGPGDCVASPLGVSGPSARAAAAASPAALSITALAVNLGTGLAPNAAAAAALGNGWGAVSLVAVGAGAVVGCDWARAWLEKAAVWGEERRRRGEKKAGWGG